MNKLIVEDLKNTLENVIELFENDYKKSVSVDLSLVEFEALLKICKILFELWTVE